MNVVITVATTGPIATKADNPTLPTQPQEIADAVYDAYLQGASVAHVHLRDPRDRPTADLGIAARTMDLIAERCPILIQLSTGVGLAVPFEDRAALVELRPRMATLNPAGCIWQIIAIGRTNLQLTAMGLAMGGNARAGMEDTLYLGKGRPAEGNRELVARTVRLARDLDLDVGGVDDTVKQLCLPN